MKSHWILWAGSSALLPLPYLQAQSFRPPWSVGVDGAVYAINGGTLFSLGR